MDEKPVNGAATLPPPEPGVIPIAAPPDTLPIEKELPVQPEPPVEPTPVPPPQEAPPTAPLPRVAVPVKVFPAPEPPTPKKEEMPPPTLQEELATATPAPEARPGSVVRTYESDIASAMREKKGSVVKIALAEHERRVREEEPETRAPKRRWPVMLALSLIATGVMVLAAAYFIRGWDGPGARTANAPVAARSIIVAETSKGVALSGISSQKLREALRAEIAREDFRLDTIEQVYFTQTEGGAERLATTEEFFRVAGSRMPNVLLRSLRPEFMYGIHAFNGNEPFLILRTDFYENAFLGLLRWETSMATDLFALFSIPLDETNKPLVDKPFQDAVLKNQDARVLLNDRGAIVLLYAIPNRETIVITTSADTLAEVVRRLGAPQGTPR